VTAKSLDSPSPPPGADSTIAATLGTSLFRRGIAEAHLPALARFGLTPPSSSRPNSSSSTSPPHTAFLDEMSTVSSPPPPPQPSPSPSLMILPRSACPPPSLARTTLGRARRPTGLRP
jgi:hypothetical protein